jgi:hypothetical protein
VHIFLPGWRVRSGWSALREIAAVLPGGILIAPYFALPGIRALSRRTDGGPSGARARRV